MREVETAHTPGEWEAMCDLAGYWFVTPDSGSTQTAIRTVCMRIASKADARLIAAAPDLLEALEYIVENGLLQGQYVIHEKAATIASAAISKALEPRAAANTHLHERE